MKTFPKRLFALLYISAVVLGIILVFTAQSDEYHFVGASSLMYAFALAVALPRGFLACLLLSWIAVFPIALIVCYIIAARKHNYLPFSIVIGLELIVTVLEIAIKAFVLQYYDFLPIMILGLLVRSLFGCVIICFINRKGKGEREAGNAPPLSQD